MSSTRTSRRRRDGVAVRRSAIPATMRAAVIRRFGDPSVFSIEEVPTPVPNASEVLIALDTAGVGTWDPGFRSGENFEDEVEFPIVLGLDGAGTVAAVGASVTRLRVGDRVYSYMFSNPKGGFYAEYVAVAASKVATIPRGLDSRQAGALPAIGLTALQGVDDKLEIAAGENVVIHGASGNVGMIALQFAKRRGARVFATASGRDGVEFARKLGADEAIDGRTDDIDAALARFAPNGVDAVLAFLGGKDLTRCLDATKKGARLAYPNGIEPEPRKRKGLRVMSYDAESGVRQFERLNAAVEETRLDVPIAEVFPLGDVARAHERVERGHLLGRVVLDMG